MARAWENEDTAIADKNEKGVYKTPPPPPRNGRILSSAHPNPYKGCALHEGRVQELDYENRCTVNSRGKILEK